MARKYQPGGADRHARQTDDTRQALREPAGPGTSNPYSPPVRGTTARQQNDQLRQTGQSRDPDHNPDDRKRHPQDIGTARADAYGKVSGQKGAHQFQSGRRERHGLEDREYSSGRAVDWQPDARHPEPSSSNGDPVVLARETRGRYGQQHGNAFDGRDPHTDLSADEQHDLVTIDQIYGRKVH